MRSTLTLALAAFLAVAGLASAEPIKFARYPHVSQGKLVFSYHGDIWIANENGSNATRLTAHVARDVFPRLSPDGRWVAFSSDRYGNNDVFIIPAAGGEPKQLTYATTPDTVLNWTPDGKGIMVATSRAVSPWRSPIYIVPIDGSLPTPMPIDGGVQGMLKQDGSTLAFNRMGATYWRKGYRGNRTDDIWLQDTKTQKITRLTDTNLRDYKDFTQDVYPMWGRDGQIYFASERSGHFNIFRIAASGGAPQQVTRHADDGVQFPSMSPDGSTIAYENEFEVWTLKVGQTTPTRVTIDLAFDPKTNLTRTVETQNRPDGFAITADGDYAAIDTRGEIFIVPTDPEFGEKRQVTSNSWRQRNQEFSPNGKWLAYTSDESKEEEIWVHDRDSGASRKLTTHPSFKVIAGFSPDSTRLAWVGNNRLFVTAVESGTTTELGYNLAGGYTVTGWSPDGNWLVYTKRDRDQNADVFLMEVATKAEHNVTQNPWNEGQAVITPDGKSVVFTSNRVDGINQVFVVPLARLTEDPNDPLVKERIRKAAAAAGGGRGGGAGAGSGQAAAAPALTRPDIARIDRRAVAITSGANPVLGFFLSTDGRTVYFRSRDDQGPALFSVAIDGRDRQRLVAGAFAGLVPTADRRKVFFTENNELFGMEMAGQRRRTRVTFTVNVRVDQRQEWAQILDESWRVMKYRFYDEKMHGKDWNALRAKYEPLLKYVGANEDVYDLANEMIGELNASHTGVSGPGSDPQPNEYQTRYLGFEMAPDAGRYKITHVYNDGPADKEWLNLKVGDYVLAIDGVQVKAGENYWPLLNSPLNEYVDLTVASTAAGADTREARIRSVASLNAIKYDAWVAHNREVVDKATNGDIAYVHIQSMNQPSLVKFQNEINQFWNKKGIIVDIRFNGGGNTDQEIIDILERRPYEYWNSRWGAPEWGRRPRQAIAGPKVMMVNARSGSDSEVTPMAFKQLGLGRVVGNPTAAAVIATGSYALINGGSIRTPGSLVVTYDPERPNNWGINLENYGVAPDVFAENTPEDELAGFDRELKAAIDEVLRMLKEGLYQYRGK
ncbi:MAG: PD40 domain-containing protein [Acidobacteria bacterium]|nr:PD40 domain-containing protein [Acidobacteriota bacterium]